MDAVIWFLDQGIARQALMLTVVLVGGRALIIGLMLLDIMRVERKERRK